MDNEVAIAELWHDVARLLPASIVGAGKLGSISDHRTQPGYVGQSYDAGRLLFVGMYPSGESRGNDNEAVFEAIARIRRRKSIDAFRSLNTVLRKEISSEVRAWGIWQYIKPVLTGAGYSVDEFALINLCPWRCEDWESVKASQAAASMYDECWTAFVRSQIEILNPLNIVALGSGAARNGTGEYLGRKGVEATLHSISRGRNDGVFGKDTEDHIFAIVRELQRPVKERRPLIPPTET